ncbi:hypothetical protein DPMN_090336 [Dreissena polymorpha]|uniref:Sushi domain-containing protein n=1 Tax=Dreissena polymorpha TaxID=45954 RepID=A0A9D4KXJ5_DREPO|nr:hypothetical protein DPMN_090336 [Dreissena polymorpha]
MDGSNMDGSHTTSCNGSGYWDAQMPRCLLIDCGDIQPPLNGYVMYAQSTLNTTATYNFDIGFVLTGFNVTTCNSSGKWTTTPPKCPIVDCGDLSVPDNGFVILSRNTAVFGTNAMFS